jgi:hypothetical protein
MPDIKPYAVDGTEIPLTEELIAKLNRLKSNQNEGWADISESSNVFGVKKIVCSR